MSIVNRLIVGLLCLGPMAAVRAQVDVRIEQPPGWERFDGAPRLQPLTSEQLASISLDPELLVCVEQLEDSSYAVREQASQKLLELASDKLQLYALLERQTLSAEQRYRLLKAARDRLTQAPRGALGISMDRFFFNGGQGPFEIRVSDLLPNLPASRVLRIGDVITQVDHQPLMQADDLQFRVQSKKPGEVVSLTVRRNKTDDNGKLIEDENHRPIVETIEIDLELGDAELLRDQQGRPQPASRVEQMRRVEADAIATTYAPQPELVAVQGGTAQFLSGRRELPPLGDLEFGADPQIDGHHLIQALIAQRRAIADGVIRDNEALRQSWEQQLLMLVQQARSPQVTREQKAYLNRVIERFAELAGQ